jgi:hypothetical protein
MDGNGLCKVYLDSLKTSMSQNLEILHWRKSAPTYLPGWPDEFVKKSPKMLARDIFV